MIGNPRGLIILDRDGVLNELVVDAEHGTIDSPMAPDQVVIIPGVPEALKELNDLGFVLAIATNQPSAAKGKTTRANLEAVHERVVAAVTSCGAEVITSQICWHRKEDGCSCRKPAPGMLLKALSYVPNINKSECWMVGDGVTDVQAGHAAGLKTAFLGLQHCPACKLMKDYPPTRLFDSVSAFVRSIAST